MRIQLKENRMADVAAALMQQGGYKGLSGATTKDVEEAKGAMRWLSAATGTQVAIIKTESGAQDVVNQAMAGGQKSAQLLVDTGYRKAKEIGINAPGSHGLVVIDADGVMMTEAEYRDFHVLHAVAEEQLANPEEPEGAIKIASKELERVLTALNTGILEDQVSEREGGATYEKMSTSIRHIIAHEHGQALDNELKQMMQSVQANAAEMALQRVQQMFRGQSRTVSRPENSGAERASLEL